MKLSKKTAGSGPPLVLLHGGLGSVNHWHRNFDVLAQHYTVHALDMPGYGPGPIAAVEGLRRGDLIVVRSGGTTTRYAVADVRSVRKSQLDLGALFARDGAPVLHVVTCGGAFDPETRRYDRNVVVTATPVT